MNRSLKRVAVLGAGTMGSQIAAHLANAEIPTLLLDLAAGGPDRNAVARGALQRLSETKPAPFYLPEKARFIQIGNLEDDLPQVEHCDWILEAVVERLDIKRELWARVEKHRHPGTIVSTNTSGLPIARIAEGRTMDFQKHFLGTHFFNPPRYMQLLELIRHPETLPVVVETVAFLGERLLGKGIVEAKDTPNFVANRIGSFVAMRVLQLQKDLELTVEEVDELSGPLIGFPRTATFRLADLVGIDVLVLVAENLYYNLPDDPWRETFLPPPFLKELVSRNRLGRKTGQGFYQKSGRELQVLDLDTLEYRPLREVSLESLERIRAVPDPVERIRRLMGESDRAGHFVWSLFRDTLLYAARCAGEICDEYFQIDRAMRWGFNWTAGPFELWQKLGFAAVLDRIRSEEMPVAAWVEDLAAQPRREFYTTGAHQVLYFDLAGRQFQVIDSDPEKIKLTVLREQDRVILSNPQVSFIDLGEGVACLEFHSKANTIGEATVELAREALEDVNRRFLGLVIGNQGAYFSAGANLQELARAAEAGRWDQIEGSVRAFQEMNMAFRYSPKPVVAAPFRRVLGGAAEMCLSCDAMVAMAETYMGLVEVGVGLIPAGGGTKEMLVRCCETAPESDLLSGVRRAFETIGKARVSGSAEEARLLGFLRQTDSIEIHPDRLLHRARQKVVALLADGYVEPVRSRRIRVAGAGAQAVLKLTLHHLQKAGYLSEHDVFIGRKLAWVLCGGDLSRPTEVPEEYLLELEREAFLSLCGHPRTQDRIRHLLATGKPLRN